jgi:hypothetical protein
MQQNIKEVNINLMCIYIVANFFEFQWNIKIDWDDSTDVEYQCHGTKQSRDSAVVSMLSNMLCEQVTLL